MHLNPLGDWKVDAEIHGAAEKRAIIKHR